MARGKKPTRKQKELIKKNRLNTDNWLVIKSPPGELHIIHRYTSTKRVIKNKAIGGRI